MVVIRSRSVIWTMKQVLPPRSSRLSLGTPVWTAASLNTVTSAPRRPWPTTQPKSTSLTSWESWSWTTCAWPRPANRRPSSTCCWRWGRHSILTNTLLLLAPTVCGLKLLQHSARCSYHDHWYYSRCFHHLLKAKCLLCFRDVTRNCRSSGAACHYQHC